MATNEQGQHTGMIAGGNGIIGDAPGSQLSSVSNNFSTASNNGPTTSTSTGPTPPIVVLNKQRLQELVSEIDPCEQLDEEVEDVLLQMADDFVDSVVTSACQFATHRGAKSLEVKDVQLVLEKEWNINIPGFGTPLTGLNRLKSHSAMTEAHKQRMALIKKTLKKL